MNNMNQWDVEEAYERVDPEETPVLARATEAMLRVMQWTNCNSDGWPYWQKPRRATDKLAVLIETGMGRFPYMDMTDPTETELRKALSPVKAFFTRQGVDGEAILNPPPPPCSHTIVTAATEAGPFTCDGCGQTVEPVAFAVAS